MMKAGHRILVSIAALSVASGLTACGAGSKSSTTTTKTTSATTITKTSSATGATPTAASKIHATLHAPDHTPTAGKLWPYSIHVTDASGHPLSGTVRIQFTFAGLVVGTDHPPVHRLENGSWHELLTFPKEAVGHPLTFQAIVTTPAGSTTLNWPVSVKP